MIQILETETKTWKEMAQRDELSLQVLEEGRKGEEIGRKEMS